jgi:hypothetical protein
MLAVLMLSLQAQVSAIPLDSGWALTGATAEIATHRGVPAVLIDNGRAIRRDVRLENGTIEFDVEFTDARSFVYFQFRMESDGEFEEIYFRPHKSELSDAVQYNPVWRGDTFWQLWHGPGATAAPRLSFNRWTHVRIELDGPRAALFLDADTLPVMVIPLARPPRSGYIGVGASAPNVPALRGARAGVVANIKVRAGDSGYRFPPVAATPAPAAGSVLQWQVSPAFAADTGALTALTPQMLTNRERWPVYPVEANGVVAIGRHLTRPRPVGGAIARLVLQSEGTRAQRLYLGYSDWVTVFVNGQAVFSGNARYSFDNPRQEGLITRTQATLWLPLRDGANEVLLAVTDVFGGWGLSGRLDPADGARLVPPN